MAPVPAEDPFMLFFHGTTWESKLWPLQYWQKLAQLANANGYRVKLLWGNPEERARAQAIAAVASNVEILEPQNLTNIASLLVRSAGVVSVDTGLAHLAAALTVPAVTLYGASDSELTGTYGRKQLHLKATLPCSPCRSRTCIYQGEEIEDAIDGKRFSVKPPCFRIHPPEEVWQKLTTLLAGGSGTLDSLFYPA